MIAWLLTACVFAAEPVRVGIFVGNNEGVGQETRLVFAREDATKMRDAFVSWGGIAPANAYLLQDSGKRALIRAFDNASERLTAARAANVPTELVFFYSGHGDEEGLHLGTTSLPHDELRGLLEQSGADVRIALLDACRSGGAIRAKGGVRGPPMNFQVAAEQVKGTAILTSSAASEYSQESSELGGGFFTHYLHTALMGAADANVDGRVTLQEAYSYVYSETAFSTRDTPDQQTPSMDLDLVGAGEVSLTQVGARSSWLVFDGALDGTFTVWDEENKRYVAEMDGGNVGKILVNPGEYVIYRRQPGWVDEARYLVRRDHEQVVVSQSDFVSVPFDDTTARRAISRQVKKAMLPNTSARILIGGRGFGEESVFGKQYLPTHVVAGVAVRFLPARRTGLFWEIDVLSGAGSAHLEFEHLSPRPVLITSTSAAGNLGFATPPWLLRAGFAGRFEVIWFGRRFLEDPIPRQDTVTVAPGINIWTGFHYGRLQIDLTTNLLILPLTFDDVPDVPVFGEVLLSVGYRF